MAVLPNWFSVLRDQMQGIMSRTDALRPLASLSAILLLALLGGVYENSPIPLIILISALFTLTVIIYLICYGFLLRYDRDALRSERYSLQKIAIQHGIFGDSTSGVIDYLPDDRGRESKLSGPQSDEDA
jgi:hypothetical protein